MKRYRASPGSSLVWAVLYGLALGLGSVTTPAAQNQWSVIDLHPVGIPGLVESRALATTDRQQVGYVRLLRTNTIVSRACLWSNAASNYVDLHPDGWWQSAANATCNAEQVGYAQPFPQAPKHALIWQGNASQWTDVHPPLQQGGTEVYRESELLSTTCRQRAGYAIYQLPGGELPAGEHAAIWTGTPLRASFRDLHPSPHTDSWSRLTFTTGIQQGGAFSVGTNPLAYPALWSGSTTSIVMLPHPAPQGAIVTCHFRDAQQGGYILVDGQSQATLWFGPQQPRLSLHASPWRASEIHGTIGDYQVGAVRDAAGHEYACLWAGQATAWSTNLHQLLGPRYRSSCARSIWTDRETVFIAGYAGTSNGVHAVLWVGPYAPPACTLQPLGFLPPAGFQFLLRGNPALQYALEVSTDLNRWDPITPLMLSNAVGVFRYADPRAALFPRRYYRGRSLPLTP